MRVGIFVFFIALVSWCITVLVLVDGRLDLLYERQVPARHFATYRLYDGDVDKT